MTPSIFRFRLIYEGNTGFAARAATVENPSGSSPEVSDCFGDRIGSAGSGAVVQQHLDGGRDRPSRDRRPTSAPVAASAVQRCDTQAPRWTIFRGHLSRIVARHQSNENIRINGSHGASSRTGEHRPSSREAFSAWAAWQTPIDARLQTNTARPAGPRPARRHRATQ